MDGAVEMSRLELAEHVGVSKSTMYNWSHLPGFPPSVRIRGDRIYDELGEQPAVLWDLRAVEGWVAEVAKLRAGRRTRHVPHDVRAAWIARRAAVTAAEVRRLRAAGLSLWAVADELGVSLSVVKRAAAGVLPARRTVAVRLGVMSDFGLLEAIRASGAATVYRYDRWRHIQTEPQPASSTIIARFGSWSAARETAAEPARVP